MLAMAPPQMTVGKAEPTAALGRLTSQPSIVKKSAQPSRRSLIDCSTCGSASACGVIFVVRDREDGVSFVVVVNEP